MRSPTKAELLSEVAAQRSEIAALQRRQRELSALLQAHQAVTSSLDLQQSLRAIVVQAAAIAGEAGVSLFLVDELKQVLRCEVSAGSPLATTEDLVIPLGTGLLGQVAIRRAPLTMPDSGGTPGAWPPDLAEPPRAVFSLGIPVMQGDRLFGVLGFSGPAPPAYSAGEIELLTAFARRAAVALEHARLHETAIQRGRELDALWRATRSVMSGLDLQGILDRILGEAARISGAPHVKVLLLDKDAGMLRVGALKGSAMPPGFSLPLGVGSSGIVAHTGEPLFMADAQNDPRSIFTEGDRKLGIVTYLGLPIKNRGQVLGVLTFNTTVPRQYTPDEMDFLTSFADQAAIAIENARLYEAAQRELEERRRAEAALRVRTEQLEAVRAIGEEITRELDLRTLLDLIIRRAVELVGASSGHVRLWDEARQLLIPQRWVEMKEGRVPLALGLGEGVVGMAARLRQGLIVNDFRTSAFATPQLLEHASHTAVLGQPLLYRGRLIGAISVTREEGQGPFTEEDLQVLGLFAGQAAITIENARLHGAALRRGEEMEALLRATRTVMGELDLQQILDRIVTEAAEITRCSHVKLLLVDPAAKILRMGAVKGTVLPEEFQIPLGVGLSGQVAATGKPLFVADPGSDPDNILAEPDRQMGVTTYLGLPVRSRDRVLGVLTFNTTTPHRYTSEELAYLGSFADHAAIALEKAQLFQELNQSYAYLQRAQDELIRAEKLRALGQMSAGIAHDLNNTLAAILARVELLRLQVREPEIQESLRMLETAATDGAQVVRRLQDFAGQRERSLLAPVGLAQAVTEALEITRPRWRDEVQRQGRVIEVQSQLDGIPPILGDVAEVREVLTNLILNAVDAMPQGGTLSFLAQKGGADAPASGGGSDPQAQLPPSTSPGWVELVVTDTGVGMPEEVRKRIFDPFFTTKGGRGTGLGLSVVYGIMERHGGHVTVRSVPGRGTTVTLRFQSIPRTLQKEGSQAPRTFVAPKRVLLVDDDPMVRSTMASLLRAAGHQVDEADGAAAGIARLGEGAVDLVLTDLGMPELTGWDMARAVRDRAPRVPVILLTGWGEHGAGEASVAGLVDRVLGKPVRLEDLLALIDELTKAAG
jgi:GAF domain-containing protein/CheY-like chemotaxis protein